ncbi:MAG: RNA 2',3'-cyclic phosphodiesterase [Christensenellaceae bacterium]|nr:RNA 2',3'-cyclic phosphodiesterase [Christensenellaceae bacterium]
MRLFIAIELNKAMRSEISRALKELKIRSSGGRFVHEDNLHITLHFIGESVDLNGAVQAMKASVRGIRPFELFPDQYGYFERNGSKTSFISVGGQLTELDILHESLESALADNGFSREYKRFVPHITLGRSVEHDELVGEEMKQIQFSTSIIVPGITLFESTRERGRMVYTPLHREKF